MTTDPAGKVETVRADRWLVKVGPGRMFNLTRPVWEASTPASSDSG